MTKQTQRRLAAGLGAAAAAMLLLTVFRGLRQDHPHPVILERAVISQPLTEADFRLDLNTASAEELETLPGIGPVLASRILARRAEAGPFETKDDVLAVKGIGEATYAALEPFIKY